MGKLKVIPIYLNLIYLQDCKYLKTTKLCTTSILTCFFCGDSFGAAFVNWTRWSSWYSSFLLVEWTCNKTWQGHLVTSSWHWPRCRPDTWPRTGSGGCGWSAPTRWCRCWPAPPRSYQTSPPHSRYTEIKLNVSSATKMLKVLHFLLSDGRELTAIRLCSSRQGLLQSSSKLCPGEQLRFWKIKFLCQGNPPNNREHVLLTWRDLRRSDLPPPACWQLWVFLICSRKHSENTEKTD